MTAIFWIIGIVVGLFALDRLFLWMESKGWLYWRKVKRKGGAAAGLLAANAIFDPAGHHAMEVREERLVEEDEDDGDDEDKRKPDDRLT